MEEQVTWFISQFSAEIDGMMANKEAVGDAPGDNAVGSEQRAFGRNSALSELKKKLTDKT